MITFVQRNIDSLEKVRRYSNPMVYPWSILVLLITTAILTLLALRLGFALILHCPLYNSENYTNNFCLRVCIYDLSSKSITFLDVFLFFI